MKDGKIVLELFKGGFNAWTESYRIVKGLHAWESGGDPWTHTAVAPSGQAWTRRSCPTLLLGVLRPVTGHRSAEFSHPCFQYPHFHSFAGQHKQPKDQEAGLYLASFCERLTLEQPRVRDTHPSRGQQSMCHFDSPSPPPNLVTAGS